MERESGATRSIIDELHSWDIHRDQMEGESGVTRNMVNELQVSDIQGDQMKGASGVIRSIIDDLHSLHIQGDQMEGEKIVSLEVSSMNLIPILWMSKEIKWKVKVVVLEVY